MTKQEFLNIIDSGNETIIKSYINDEQFINFVKEVKDEFNKSREKSMNDFHERESNRLKKIKELIKQNKDVVPSIETLSVKHNDKDFYDEVCEDFTDGPDTASGDVLICTYSYNDDVLKVKGMYKNVEVHNFQNEQIFIIDGDKVKLLGSSSDPLGASTLEEFLNYIESDPSSVEIDSNVFNTNANYFVML
jgi:hypothetical protein